MSVREEFEKAYNRCLFTDKTDGTIIALWAAKWMGERIAQEAKHWPNDDIVVTEIRQLIRKLEG